MPPGLIGFVQVEAIGPDAAWRLNRSPDDYTRKQSTFRLSYSQTHYDLDLNVNGTTVFGR